MVRLVSDINFNGDIVRGLRLRIPNIDLVRGQDAGLDGVLDPELLEWAANADRIVLTHDKATLPDFAYARVAISESMPGVFVVNNRMPILKALNELATIDGASEHAEWRGRVLYLPL